jgi:sialic acid synthase SpsE
MYPCTHNSAVRFECEANYPSTLKWRGDAPGFSDHSGNPWRAIDAIARGCQWVEVHFYDDPSEAGPDLPASLDPDQLALVCKVRDAF